MFGICILRHLHYLLPNINTARHAWPLSRRSLFFPFRPAPNELQLPQPYAPRNFAAIPPTNTHLLYGCQPLSKLPRTYQVDLQHIHLVFLIILHYRRPISFLQCGRWPRTRSFGLITITLAEAMIVLSCCLNTADLIAVPLQESTTSPPKSSYRLILHSSSMVSMSESLCHHFQCWRCSVPRYCQGWYPFWE